MEIIVYRNPIEAQFWNSWGNHPEIICYIIVGGIAIITILYAYGKIMEKIRRKW